MNGKNNHVSVIEEVKKVAWNFLDLEDAKSSYDCKHYKYIFSEPTRGTCISIILADICPIEHVLYANIVANLHFI
jgi:hypothetical protein